MLWAIFIVFLILWGFAWRDQPKLAFGIFVGLFIGAVAAPSIGPYQSIADVPLWLMRFIGFMAVEGDNTRLTRLDFFGETDFVAEQHAAEEAH